MTTIVDGRAATEKAVGAVAARKPAKAVPRSHSGWRLAALSFVAGIFLTQIVTVSTVRGNSMLPSLFDEDVVIVSKLSYTLRPIEPGDTVVLSHPERSAQLMVKRVMALPGDLVELRDGHLWVNGTEYKEEHVPWPRRGHSDRPEHVVPPSHYYVLGDNRRVSEDSRLWGDVPRRYIRGKVVFRLWPLLRAGPIPTGSHETVP